MPISALLARIRKLIPNTKDQHYDEIVRNFGVGALRPPPTPMSDRELARAIAEFLKDSPSSETVANLRRRLDPTSGVRMLPVWPFRNKELGHGVGTVLHVK